MQREGHTLGIFVNRLLKKYVDITKSIKRLGKIA
jgi:hypothetical protein